MIVPVPIAKGKGKAVLELIVQLSSISGYRESFKHNNNPLLFQHGSKPIPLASCYNQPP